MEFLAKFLPIVIYILLIVFIILGIVICAKLINSMNKIENIIDNVDKKINTLNPVFSIIEGASFKLNRVVDKFLDFFVNIFSKLFLKGKEREENEDE